MARGTATAIAVTPMRIMAKRLRNVLKLAARIGRKAGDVSWVVPGAIEDAVIMLLHDI